MGKRGPKASPTIVKLARGERRPSRINYAEPQPTPPCQVEVPKGLSGPGLELWQSLIGPLAECGLITVADVATFELVCRATTQLRVLESRLEQFLPEEAIAKGLTNAVLKLRHQLLQLRSECGLTPSSRQAVVSTQPFARSDRDRQRQERFFGRPRVLRKDLE
jgi:P27 family predicted phage terminase small subunit